MGKILVLVWHFDWLRKGWLAGGANFFYQSQSEVNIYSNIIIITLFKFLMYLALLC